MQRISLDTMGPIKASISGMKFILVVIDHFTKYVWVFALPDVTANTIARVLWNNIFAVFGTPEEVLTDGASSLLAKEMKELYALFQVEQLQSTAYYPKGNSVVERSNQTINKILSKAVHDLNWKVDWDEVVSTAGYAYNQAVHRSTGFSPFFLMFGRDVRSPIDLLLREPLEDRSLESYVLHLLRALQSAHATVRNALLDEDMTRLGSNDTRTTSMAASVFYKVGDLVLWRRAHDMADDKEDKHAAAWQGPFRVRAIFSATTYEIEMVGAAGEYRVASAFQLRHYHARLEEPTLPDTLPARVSPVVVGLPGSGAIAYLNIEVVYPVAGLSKEAPALVTAWEDYAADATW
jgi:hypothetical protein